MTFQQFIEYNLHSHTGYHHTHFTMPAKFLSMWPEEDWKQCYIEPLGDTEVVRIWYPKEGYKAKPKMPLNKREFRLLMEDAFARGDWQMINKLQTMRGY